MTLEPHDLLEIKKNRLSCERFLFMLDLVNQKYGQSTFRLAGEGWDHPWQTLIATIMSAQNKDEVTIVVGEELFKHYPTLEKLSKARYEDVLKIFKSMNYNRTKAKHVILSAEKLLSDFNGKTPTTIDELITLPGVGRKTANLVISEEFNIPGICVDTHVNRMANVFGFVNTGDDRDKTEMILKDLLPENKWSMINRLFVLWGKDCSSKDPKVLLEKLLE